MGFMATWLVTFVAVLIVSQLHLFVSASVGSAAIFALVLGLLNAFIRPVIKLFTLPLTIVTLGLFSLVVNLLMFWLADRLVPEVTIEGGLPGLVVAAVAISLVSSVLSRVTRLK